MFTEVSLPSGTVIESGKLAWPSEPNNPILFWEEMRAQNLLEHEVVQQLCSTCHWLLSDGAAKQRLCFLSLMLFTLKRGNPHWEARGKKGMAIGTGRNAEISGECPEQAAAHKGSVSQRAELRVGGVETRTPCSRRKPLNLLFPKLNQKKWGNVVVYLPS